ncbi:MAG: NAD-dependent epimerase/dehydratase family protein [Desulfovibrionaceae bacterium]
MSRDEVIVFGGSGFLGSHLADILDESGYKVTIFDRSDSPWRKKSQNIIIGDILNAETVNEAIKGKRFVFHLAGIADIGEAAGRPKETLTCNMLGSINILEACVTQGVERLLFASTVYVYSEKGSFYRVSKQSTELIIEAYAAQFGIGYTILRYGSLYGPRAQEWNGLKRYVTEAVCNAKVVYPGTGEERREYIHVLDAARLSVNALDPEFRNQCLTLTGAQIMTTSEMLHIIREVLGREVTIEFSTSRESYTNAHYGMTPYRYTPKMGRKIIPSTFIDIGQGILQLIEEASQTINTDAKE